MTYKLPHPLDRPGQPEAMEWILNSNKKYNILRAPTGFGKSPLAAVASMDAATMALVLHKSLQSANYQDQYQFEVLYGKGNYPCIEKNKKLQKSFLPAQMYTASDCGNPDCDCPYQRQALQCLSSDRVSLNYAKFLMSKPFVNYYQPGYLFLDEAHNLPNIVTDFVGLTLNWDDELLGCPGGIKRQNAQLTHTEAILLFRQCARAVAGNKPDQKEDLVRWRKWKRLSTKINMTNDILAAGNLEDWYYESDDKALTIKPLTAKHHFKKLFGLADKVILMSATIGPSIAERLGLEDDEWAYHEVPNSWPVPSRLVYDLGGPAMNYENRKKKEVKIEQAKIIMSVLKPDKSGIIHTMSERQAIELSYYLGNQDKTGKLQFFVPVKGTGTDNQLAEWENIRQPGAYCIAYNFWEGVDLGLDDMAIIAKVPYGSLSGNYNKARKNYDPQWYLEQTAWLFEQGCGRIRRGYKEHYAPGAKMIYIADSSWHRLKTLLSADFRRSIRKCNGK